MSPREKRRSRRAWRSSRGRRLALVIGWAALVGAVVALTLFDATGRVDVLAAAVGAAVVAMLSSGLVPEPTSRNVVRFAPLESLRAQKKAPSLARQLLTLP